MKNLLTKLKGKKRIFVLASALVFLALYMVSCEEEVVNQPPSSGEQPMSVNEVSFEGTPGGAIISYSITDEATDYVLIEYEIRPGEMRQQKSSKYKDNVVIEGFATAGEHEITIYSVNISEIRSAPLKQIVTVLEPPIISSFESLSLREDFGGINITISNEHKGNLAVELLTRDNQTGNLVTSLIHYSAQEEINYSARGFEPEPRDFWLTMRDRYGNKTDTIQVNLTPFAEARLDRSLMQEVVLPTDYGDDYIWHSWSGLSPRNPSLLFDGSTTGNSVLHTKPNTGVPMHFTIDLGVEVAMSRFKIWQSTSSNTRYAGQSPKIFEIWGSLNPDIDGSWDSWTKFGTYTIVKPSDSPVGQVSSEDQEAYLAGHEFNIPIDAGEVRYVRIKILKTWGNLQLVAFSELAFWGAL